MYYYGSKCHPPRSTLVDLQNDNTDQTAPAPAAARADTPFWWRGKSSSSGRPTSPIGSLPVLLVSDCRWCSTGQWATRVAWWHRKTTRPMPASATTTSVSTPPTAQGIYASAKLGTEETLTARMAANVSSLSSSSSSLSVA